MGTTRLLSTLATTLLIGAGAAWAGPINGPVKPERAPPAQQSAPAEKFAPPIPMNTQKKPAETTGQGTPDKLKPSSGGSTDLDRDRNPASQNSESDDPAAKRF